MQDRQINPPDDAQQQILSALYQDQSAYGASQQAASPASSEVSYPNIEKFYIFREAHEVTSFLEENSFIIPLLQEAYIHIKRYFPDSDVVLEVIHDPEIMGERDLVAFIVVKQNAKEASRALDLLDEEWWLDAIDRAQGQLHITLEFI